MKKLLAGLLALLMALSLMPLTALAANGPSEQYEMWDDEKHYFAYIYAYAPDADGEYFGEYGQNVGTSYAIFEENTVNNSCPGVEYKRDINELVIDDQNQKLMLQINMMGDDFKIRIDGNVTLAQITVMGGGHGGNLHIVGNGKLTVNKDRHFTTAITLAGNGVDSKVTVGPDVTMDLYAGNGAEDKVMETFRSSNADASQMYVFENSVTVNVGRVASSYEAPARLHAIYLADPDEERFGGYLADAANDPDNFYVVGFEEDEETGETLYTLGRYVYVAAYDAYVRDYDFGDRYSNGYEYVFTEDEWNSQTEYVIREEPSTEPENVEYRDADELDSDWYYTRPRVRRTSDPDGIYGYGEYSTWEGDVLLESGYNVYRYVKAPGTDKYIEDSSFEVLSLSEDELFNSGEWTVVYGVSYMPLTWTGTVVQGDEYLYEDADGNRYIEDYDDNVYTYGTEGIYIGEDFYYLTEKSDAVSAGDLEMVYTTVTEEGVYNYFIDAKELHYTGSGEEPPAVLTGWQTFDGKKYYLDQDGNPVTGRQSIDGKQYYFSAAGVLQTGWQKISGKWYLFNTADGHMLTGWQKSSGEWYYFNASGVMLTGWQKLSGKWYYFNASGVMLTGWQKLSGKWYYFNGSGAMLTGWQKLSGKWYYFNGSGAMLTGWQKLSGKWYLFNSSGAMLTGWQKSGGKWYYFNSSGVMLSGWQKLSGKWYYFDGGAMLANTSKKIGSKTYRFNASGVCTNP